MVEEVCHKMHEKGFDVSKVINARGRTPIAPLVLDEVKAIGRINDAILYGGDAEFWVDATDEEIAAVMKSWFQRPLALLSRVVWGGFGKSGRDLRSNHFSLYCQIADP
jgi:hypothetical protein